MFYKPRTPEARSNGLRFRVQGIRGLARKELEVLLVQLGGVRPIKDLRDGEFWGFFEDSLKGSARPPLRDL